jgi:hypothetical protein
MKPGDRGLRRGREVWRGGQAGTEARSAAGPTSDRPIPRPARCLFYKQTTGRGYTLALIGAAADVADTSNGPVEHAVRPKASLPSGHPRSRCRTRCALPSPRADLPVGPRDSSEQEVERPAAGAASTRSPHQLRAPRAPGLARAAAGLVLGHRERQPSRATPLLGGHPGSY